MITSVPANLRSDGEIKRGERPSQHRERRKGKEQATATYLDYACNAWFRLPLKLTIVLTASSSRRVSSSKIWDGSNVHAPKL